MTSSLSLRVILCLSLGLELRALNSSNTSSPTAGPSPTASPTATGVYRCDNVDGNGARFSSDNCPAIGWELKPDLTTAPCAGACRHHECCDATPVLLVVELRDLATVYGVPFDADFRAQFTSDFATELRALFVTDGVEDAQVHAMDVKLTNITVVLNPRPKSLDPTPIFLYDRLVALLPAPPWLPNSTLGRSVVSLTSAKSVRVCWNGDIVDLGGGGGVSIGGACPVVQTIRTEDQWEPYQKPGFWTQQSYIPAISGGFCALVCLVVIYMWCVRKSRRQYSEDVEMSYFGDWTDYRPADTYALASRLSCCGKCRICIGVIWSLASIVLAVLAYQKWNNATSQFDGVLNNWASAPIVDVHLTDASTCNLGAGWEMAPYSARAAWELAQDACFSVDDGQLCRKKGEEVHHLLTRWRGGKLCVKRLPAQFNIYGRPQQSGTPLACPATLRSCGEGLDCYPAFEPCPITSLLVTVPGPVAPDTEQRSMGGGAVLEVRRDTLSEVNRPLVDLRISRAGLPCIKSSSGSPVNLRPPTGGPCGSSLDHRFVLVDKYNEPDLLEDNGAPMWLRDIGRVTLDACRGIVCGAGQTCEHGVCVDESPVPRSDGTRTWDLAARPQILWAQVCQDTRDESLDVSTSAVASVSTIVKRILTMQMMVLVISCVMGVFNLYASHKIWRELTDNDDANDEKTSKRKVYCNILGQALVMMPTALAILMVYNSNDFFLFIVEKKCSDDITNRPFTFLADNAGRVLTINICKVAGGFLYLVYRFARLVFQGGAT
mmetsp:Transcript_17392/g.19511  ORF Transcript_17392/g.19511 Transcript_17392/m.19511 type:complete len:774 (+) Transcript_17392:49-2370(+)|eukprot:CAMPEP_0205831554 /NCGR_PEP_ID=MMETSP0206-20130828/44359_1 /ASSEMBLY_ACC=CAM_ASM_000279 /TAXON_ID=36767 /ORGANISM="Euplotes focardii, Strain TN1" /LENGTH=773 /DNA_ID=CAMNT_0053136279 /DNA_START=42 /DNA_END=2363 /DNA_ORIENTATION=+